MTEQADAPNRLQHESVTIVTGERSNLPLIAAVHSTALGTAVGGCRMWHYPDWRDGLADALRLSEAMSFKCAAAGLEHGGGKSVIALPDATPLDADRRVAVMRDLGDLVQSLGGRYTVAEDVGVHAEDMAIVRERTEWAACLPESAGGAGEPAEPTAAGVYASLRATAKHALGTDDPAGLRVAIVGLGQVGARLARRLAAAGAQLIVSDIDAGAKALADELGADWADPADAMFTAADIVVPAALGGVLSAASVPRLRCAAVVGPANNQLTDPGIADLLAERGIVWAPDFVVNAGGVVYGVGVEIDARPAADVLAEVDRIGDRLTDVFAEADRTGRTPNAVATELAHARLAIGGVIA